MTVQTAGIKTEPDRIGRPKKTWSGHQSGSVQIKNQRCIWLGKNKKAGRFSQKGEPGQKNRFVSCNPFTSRGKKLQLLREKGEPFEEKKLVHWNVILWSIMCCFLCFYNLFFLNNYVFDNYQTMATTIFAFKIYFI